MTPALPDTSMSASFASRERAVARLLGSNRVEKLGRPVDADHVHSLSGSGAARIWMPQMADISATVTRLHVDPLGVAAAGCVERVSSVRPGGAAAPAQPPASAALRTIDVARVGIFETSPAWQSVGPAEL